MTRAGLPAEAVADAFVAVVVPPGLEPDADRRARAEATAFLDILLLHLDGDAGALASLQAAVRAVATETVSRGDDPGILLDRFDAGRHAIMRALLERGLDEPAAVVDADDRLREVQHGIRTAIHDAVSGFEAVIDRAVGDVTRAIESGAAPDDVMRLATATLSRLVEADRARLWVDAGAGRLELMASAGSAAPPGSTVSADEGVLAAILGGGVPVRQCPVDPDAWSAAIPNLPVPGSALFLPLVAAGHAVGLLYALRDDPLPFTEEAEHTGARFAERVEPALAWALQLRALRRWADASQDFLRFITHELRRPLTVLRGYLDMLEGVGAEEGVVLRERMGRAADQLAAMLTGITDTVTLEDPIRPLNLTRISLSELLDSVLRATHDEALQQGVRLIADVVDGDTLLQCDLDTVMHALANLLSNAFRHTAGERRVWLSAAPADGRFARFTVRDEGTGIATADRERIFLKYFRSEATRRSGSAGSGLGLYFVRLVAERHGGRVAAENRPEGGARFTLELPLEPGLAPWGI